MPPLNLGAGAEETELKFSNALQLLNLAFAFQQ